MAVFLARMVMPRSRSRSFEIHHAHGHLLVLAEGMCLAQQPVDQGGFAMVDVGDDGDISKVGSFT